MTKLMRTMAIPLNSSENPEEAISEVPSGAEGTPASPDAPPSSQDGSGATDTEPEVWIHPPHNSEGLSYNYQFRGVPELEYWMNEVVYSRRFPYRNKRDIMRHALHRHTAWLQSHSGCPRAPGTVELEMLRVLESEEYEQQFMHLIRKFDKLVSKALNEGNPTAAERLAKRLWMTLNQLELGPWREHYVREFKAKYGKFLH
jgi:hypothetical protein